MVFKYWMENGKATVINEADRLVFDSPGNLMVRFRENDLQKWKHLVFKEDYVQFTMVTE